MLTRIDGDLEKDPEKNDSRNDENDLKTGNSDDEEASGSSSRNHRQEPEDDSIVVPPLKDNCDVDCDIPNDETSNKNRKNVPEFTISKEGEYSIDLNLALVGPHHDNKISVSSCPPNLVRIIEGEVLETPVGHDDVKKRFSFDLSPLYQNELKDGENGTTKDSRRGTITSEDDDMDSVDIPAELPPPPDGGWGWVVVFASFLANMIVDGTAYSFSPFLGVFSAEFDEPQGKVAWISSLLAGVYLSAGPIVSALTNKFGCRVVCISGGIVASAAYASTLLANSVVYLMVTQGLIAGFGFGLIYLPAVVCVGYYFETKRALATGIAVCGSGVGTMIFPPLINLIIENYGWKGANLFIAGLILNCCWMGALMRPLEVPKMKKKHLLQRLAEEKKLALELGSFYGSNYFTVTHSDGSVEKKLKPGRVVNQDPGVHSHLNLSGYLTPVSTSLALPTIQEGGQPADNTSEEKKIPPLPPVAAPIDDEKDSLVVKTSPSKPSKAQIVAGKMPRNKSQPSMEKNGGTIPQIGSVPNFERKMSKIDLVNQMKVVPATPEASYTNLRLLDRRHSSQGYGRVTSAGSFGESEAGTLRRRKSSKERKGIMLPPMARQDIFYTGSISHLQEFKSQSSMMSYRESTYNLHSTAASRVVMDALEDDVVDDAASAKTNCLGNRCSSIKDLFDLSLLKNPVFLIVGFANMIGMLGFYTPFVYLPAAAVEKGISKDKATLLVSIIGITNTVGRVLSGLLADIPRVNALWVNNVSIIFSGLCVFLIPFAYSFTAFVFIAIFFGFFVSSFIALCSIIIVDLFGLKQLTKTFGLINVFRGVAAILGPPLAGSIYDATKNYDVSFYFAGILLFLCAILHCIIPVVQKCCPGHGPVPYVTNVQLIEGMNVISEVEDCPNSPDADEGNWMKSFEAKPNSVKSEVDTEMLDAPKVTVDEVAESVTENKV